MHVQRYKGNVYAYCMHAHEYVCCILSVVVSEPTNFCLNRERYTRMHFSSGTDTATSVNKQKEHAKIHNVYYC